MTLRVCNNHKQILQDAVYKSVLNKSHKLDKLKSKTPYITAAVQLHNMIIAKSSEEIEELQNIFTELESDIVRTDRRNTILITDCLLNYILILKKKYKHLRGMYSITTNINLMKRIEKNRLLVWKRLEDSRKLLDHISSYS
jgi:hypothetical protein